MVKSIPTYVVLLRILHLSDTVASQQDNVGGNGLHHCSSEIKLMLNDISHAPPSHLKFQNWIQDGGRGTHVMHFVQLYPNHYILRARCVQQAVCGIKGC